MAQNGATFAEQYGALYALEKIANDSTAPMLAGLLMSPNSKVRYMAARALDALSLTAKTTHLDAIVNSLIAYDRPILPLDPANPMHAEKAPFGSLLFGGNGVWGSGRLSTANRAQLYPAFRIIAGAPMGGTRNSAFGVTADLTKTDVENLAEVLVEVGQAPPPAENRENNSRNDAISVLQAKSIAEGVPLSVISFLEAFNDHTVPLGILKKYAASSLTVQPDPKVPEFCQVLVSNADDFSDNAQAVLDAIEADQLPYKVPKKLTPFKRIDSVLADRPSLNLPSISTVLRVQSSDFANGTPLFTWRKVHGAGKVSFTPNGTGAAKNTAVVFDGTPGTYLFEVKMSDSRGLTEVTKTVEVTLRGAGGTLPTNSPPTASNQMLVADQGTPTQMILNAADPEGYPLNYTVTTGPEYGSLTGTAPNLVYTPNANYTGPDSITYQVQDSEGELASATVNITVNTTTPVGLAIYEPFDTTSTGSLSGTAGSGSIGLNGSWTAGASITTDAPSLSYGTLPVQGNKVKSVSINHPGGSRGISTSALAGRGLLDNGATVWLSVMLHAYTGSPRVIDIALANNGFPYGPNIPNDGIQTGSELGVRVDGGLVYAAQFYDAAVGAPLIGNNDSAVAGGIAVNKPRLVVAKITWGATSDKIEVFMPWEDMLLPAPTSVLTANVNQSLFDTLTFSRGQDMFLDEIRVGATYQSVVQGTVAMIEDNTAPTPNPMSFVVAPTPSGPSSITMTASTAHDPLEVEYYFECTGGGGHDSGWQASPIYTDTGLTPGVEYTYQVKARDKNPGLNETTLSTAASATIPALGTVPNVVGILQTSAEDLLETASLSVGSITSSASYSLTIPAGHVLSQSPAVGSAAYGSPVNLEISIGQDPALPTLAPLDIVDDKNGSPVVINTPITYTLTFSEDIDAATLDPADFMNVGNAASVISAITEISPGVVTVIVTPTSTGFLRFAVTAGASINDAQGHAFNSTYETNDDTVITSQLSSVSVPNVVGLTQAAAESAIISANLVVGTVDSIYSTTVVVGRVISQTPAGGGSLPGQHAVNLVLSLGSPPDTTRPLIASFSPADDSTNVAVGANLLATFNENIAIGTGNITFKNLTSGTHITIPVTDTTQVSISGAILTINPTAVMISDKNYAVQIDGNAIKDTAGNSFAGIADDTTWNFRTADITPPAPNPMTFAVLPNALSESSITMTATTAADPNGVQYFFECTTSGGSSSAWQDSPVYTATGLDSSTSYTFTVRARDKSAAQNITNTSTPASATTNTPDIIPPAIFSLLPAHGATSVSVTTNLTVTFNEQIKKGSGNIIIRHAGGAPIESIPVSDAKVVISGSSATINPSGRLPGGEILYVEIDSGAILDLVNNPFPGISGSSTWSFATNTLGTATALLDEDFESPVYADGTSIANGSYGTNFLVGTGNGIPGTVKSRNSNTSSDVPGTYVAGNSNASNHVLHMEYNSPTTEAGEFWFNIPAHTWSLGQTYTLTVNASPALWEGTKQRYIRPSLRQQDKTVLWTAGQNVSTAVPLYNNFGRQAWSNAQTFSWTFSSDDFVAGTEGNLIQVHLDSSGQRGLYVDNVVLTVIQSPNDSPVWTSNPVNEANATEDANYNWTLADDSSDANGNTLTFAKLNGPAWLSVAANGLLSGIPTNDDVGLNSFTVSVSDGIAPAVETTLNITVININDAPVFATNPVPSADATEYAAYTGSLAGSASDVDAGATLAYAKVSGPSWLSIASNGTFTGTPSHSDAGANSFMVSVSDGIAPAVQATLNIFVFNTTLPAIFSLSPAHAATSVPVVTNLTVTFNEPVKKGSGNIVIRSVEGATIESIPVSDARVVISGSSATIDPAAAVPGGKILYVEIDNGAILDLADNSFPGISGSSTWKFTTSLLDVNFESPVYADGTSMVNGSYGTNFFVGTGSGVPGTVKSKNSNTSSDVPGTYVAGNSNASNHVLNMEYNSPTTETGEFWFNIPTHTWAAGQTYTLTLNASPMSWNGHLQRYIRPSLRQQDKTVLWTVGANASTALPLYNAAFGRQPWTAAQTFSWTFNSDDFLGGTEGSLIQVHLDSSGQRGLYVDNIMLTVSSESGGPGPVASFAISPITSPQTVGTPITGITLTAKDASGTTATDFTGTVTFGGTGGFTGTSANFIAGELTGVSVTPWVAGSNLTFTVNDSSSHTGSITLATIRTPYEVWATGGVVFNQDTNNDGVDNGMAWLLGATSPSENALSRLPVATRNGANLRLTFRCLKSTKRGGAVLKVQSSSDMGLADPWANHEAAVPDVDSTVNGVIFDTTDDGDFIQVTADIPATQAKLFGRLISQ